MTDKLLEKQQETGVKLLWGKIVLIAAQRIAFRRNIHIMKAVIRHVQLVKELTMAEHLRFAACYWHTFCWNGADMFGVGAFDRPWHLIAAQRIAFRRNIHIMKAVIRHVQLVKELKGDVKNGDALQLAKQKADVAFEFFHKLNVPYYCFHDVDVWVKQFAVPHSSFTPVSCCFSSSLSVMMAKLS
jgi:xylose isomerase